MSVESSDQPGLLFGEVNRSPVWALDSKQLERENPVSIAQDQVICVLQRSGVTAISCACGARGQIEGDGMVVWVAADARTGSDTGGEIRFSDASTEGDAILFGFQQSVLRQTLAPVREGVKVEVRKQFLEIESPGKNEFVYLPLPDLIRERVFDDLRNPPVSGAARNFWFESLIRELIALCFFAEEAPGKKAGRGERIETAKRVVLERLEEPLDLGLVAKIAGCSKHYLSRKFSEETGMTLMQFQRKARIQKAAELLKQGKCNVSEVATRVGYRSLSHFSKAFLEVEGVLPSKYSAEQEFGEGV